MARMDKLWRTVDGPGVPPTVKSGRVKARVNAALDAGQKERKVYMKQKLCTAMIAIAVLAVITGTAFAAIVHWDALSAWFAGDTSPGLAYLDNEARSVSDENYTLTVESAAADESSVYLTVKITALSDAAKEFLYDGHFNSIDTFGVIASFDSSAPSAPGSAPDMGVSFTTGELEAGEENSRRYSLAVAISSSAGTLRVRCGYMDKGLAVEVPIVPAPSLTVKIGASGTGILEYFPASAVASDALTIKEITLSAFTCHVEAKCSDSGVHPHIFLRLADGSIRTQSQMMAPTGASFNAATHQAAYHYRFNEVQDLDGIVSVIVFDMEYPLDGSQPTPVEHDPALDPFTVKRMERLEEGGGFSIPVRDLTEGLGGTCVWDAAAGEMTCVYRGVTIVLRAGSKTALVDGETVALHQAPALQNGSLAAPSGVFTDAWGIRCCVQREKEYKGDDLEIIWCDWYVIP